MSDSDPTGAGLIAPVDPRLAWMLPALGEMPRVARLDDLVNRVLAPNPSAMALDGTNTYVLSRPGSGAAVLVDPGPPDPEHLRRVQGVLAEIGAQCELILVTHHHIDHAEAAQPWGRELGAPVAAGSAGVAGPDGRILSGGDIVRVGGLTVTAVATPGHCGDHLAFRLDSGAVLVGDHILGRGTSVVTYPEGDLLAYLESLRRVHDLGPDVLYPGHGPQMRDDPSAVIDFYLAHRLFREEQILAVLRSGPADPAGLVRVIYSTVDTGLWPFAEQSTRAALAKLAAEGRVNPTGTGLWTVAG